MNKKTIKDILEKNNLNFKEKRWLISKLITLLSKYDKNEFIYPRELYWLYRNDKDYLYAVLDIIEENRMLKKHIILRCCRCGKEKIIPKYLLKGEEIICEECEADNDDSDCMVAYEVL